MASASSSSSSSANFPQQNYDFEEKYDVFLSFRGEDTRKTFVSHLYAALSANQILTFMDDRELERGDKISDTLTKSIEESKIWVIIFSENYANSTWCLEELVHILKCKQRNEQSTVMPIFYGIDPSSIRKQKGSYERAFADLEKRFENKMGKVREWRAALKEASDLCGLHSTEFRSEAKLVKKIVEDIMLKLQKCQASNEHYKWDLIGMEERIEKIISLLSIGSPDVRTIGIWGMGGIGKTTLAGVVYHELSYSQFEGRCFLQNVGDPDGLRKKLLSELLNDEAIAKTDIPFVPSPYIVSRLRRKKVLLVLDDVNSSMELEALLQGYDDALAPGSRIIVTTRNVRALDGVPKHCIYKVERLNPTESLELFLLRAFGKSSSLVDDDEQLLKKVARYADGNPLALKVLGSFLKSKRKEEWEEALNYFKKFPDKGILNVLRTSYEGIDKRIQNIFLDIACLFDGPFTRDGVESLLDDGNPAWIKFGINELIEKSFIEDSKWWIDNKLRMHDLLRQMGRNIVCDEHIEAGGRSRLWDAKDVSHVLERNTGTVAVEVISLNMSTMKKDIKAGCSALSKMCNLRILKIDCGNNIGNNKFKLTLHQEPDPYLSENLNYFHWDLYPLKSLPSNFIPESLVELRLRGSHVQKLWSHEVQPFLVLRRMDLSCSKLLTEIPDLSQLAPNLESLNLENCTSLIQVLPSLQNLDKLANLNLNGCANLRDFKEISRSRWYQGLVSSGGVKNFLSNICQQKLTFLTSFINNTSTLTPHAAPILSLLFPMNLRVLHLSGTPVEALPLSIGSLSGLVELHLRNCKQLGSLPPSIFKVKSLESLDLSGCVKLERFPEISEHMEGLKKLWLDETGIKELPESIGNLVSLKNLHLTSCKEIEFLPNKLSDLSKLESLELKGCSKLENLPPLPLALESLDVQYCESLKSIPDLPLYFENLRAEHCTSLEKIPDDLKAPLLIRNRTAEFFGCEKLDQNTRNTVLPDFANCEILKSVSYDRFFRYPGDEIPNWFIYQTSETSLRIELPPFWCSIKFLGFTLCVVVELKKVYPRGDSHIRFEMKLDECPDEALIKDLVGPRQKCSDHVYMWHFRLGSIGIGEIKWPSSCSRAAYLHVYPEFSDNVEKTLIVLGSEYCQIKKWGIRFVNSDDVMRF